jgi:hypothetical protein
MGFGLYDAAFAALGRIYGTGARGAITITLLAGFASDQLAAHRLGRIIIGWRDTCLAWAALHIFVARRSATGSCRGRP